MTEYTELKGKHKDYQVQLLEKIISKTHTMRLKVWSENFFNAVRLWHCDHFTGEPVLLPSHPLGKKSFSDIEPKPPLTQLQPIPLGHIIGLCREEISACTSLPLTRKL